MKAYIRPLLLILLGIALLGYNFRPMPTRVITSEQKAEHMVVFIASRGPAIECTATAIGPHAILTAEHCNSRYERDPEVTIDLSMVRYKILGGIVDDRDHIIFFLDGPSFTNYLPEKALVDVLPAKPGEQITMYGFGGSRYPARILAGTLDLCAQNEDPSDVDQNRALYWYTMPAIPGDSGSALFAPDGRVVGLITYVTEHDFFHDGSSAGFALGFSEEAIQRAHDFSPDNADLVTP